MPVGRHRVYTSKNVRADFRLERRDIAKLAKSAHMRNLVVGIGRKKAMPFAKEISQEFKDHGDYGRSFRVVSRLVTYPPDRWPMRRISARLLNISDHAIWVEVGNKYSNGHRVFRKTLEYLNATSGS